MINCYKSKCMKKHIDPPFSNPHFDKHFISEKHKLFCAKSGAGKTNALLNMIMQMQDTFEEIIIYTAMPDEPLYAGLKEQIGDQCTVKPYNELVPCPSARAANVVQRLIVFDDFLNEPPRIQSMLKDYAQRGRKNTYVCCFITQSFFEVKKAIRAQCSELFMLAVSDKRDLSQIASTVSFRDGQLLQRIIKNATKFPMHICIISLGHCVDANRLIRRNFTDWYQLEDAEGNEINPVMYMKPDMKN